MGRGGGERRGGELKCYRQTYRASDEAGPRGAFAPNNYVFDKAYPSVSGKFEDMIPLSNTS